MRLDTAARTATLSTKEVVEYGVALIATGANVRRLRVDGAAKALHAAARSTAEYGSILVPVLGTPLDDDIMQTAGRLAAEENEDVGEGGAVIEALWVFEVPMALPLDARVPDERARARRARRSRGPRRWGRSTRAWRSRRRRCARGAAGEAIVREARRRGVEAIVLAAEEPTRRRAAALLLGGKAGPARHVRRARRRATCCRRRPAA